MRTASVAALVLSLSALAAGTAIGQGTASGDRPECVTADPTSGLGAYGNNLSIHVRNDCGYDVTCRVSSDVDPRTVREIHLDAGASTDVPVMRESPVRVFVARVECPMREPTLRRGRE